MKILIIRFSALGDVAMAAPIVKEYAVANPQDDITVLSQPFCAPLFDSLAPNVHFLGKDVKKAYKGIPGLYRLFRELHGEHFDRVCDLHDVLRTKVLRLFFRLHGYKVSVIDKGRADRKLITAPEGKKQLKQLKTSFEKYREVLGTPRAPRNPRNPRDPSDSRCPRDSRDSRTPYTLGIAPFAAHGGKIYPLAKMERVIELLIEKNNDCRIVLFGGGGKEREQMLQWQQKFPGNVITAKDLLEGAGNSGGSGGSGGSGFSGVSGFSGLSGLSGLSAELQLMKQLDCMISMDSANMHLASLVGTRVVSVWGATHPYAGFLGWGQRMEDCVQVDLPCRPCSIYGNKPCHRGDFACMNGITPEMIVKNL